MSKLTLSTKTRLSSLIFCLSHVVLCDLPYLALTLGCVALIMYQVTKCCICEYLSPSTPMQHAFKDDLLYYHDGQRSLRFDDHSL